VSGLPWKVYFDGVVVKRLSDDKTRVTVKTLSVIDNNNNNNNNNNGRRLLESLLSVSEMMAMLVDSDGPLRLAPFDQDATVVLPLPPTAGPTSIPTGAPSKTPSMSPTVSPTTLTPTTSSPTMLGTFDPVCENNVASFSCLQFPESRILVKSATFAATLGLNCAGNDNRLSTSQCDRCRV